MAQFNTDIDEHSIVRRVIAGERDEFRQLIDKYKQRIFAMVLRQVGSRQCAEDLTQDIFVNAYQHLKHFRFESTFGTWLIRITLNEMSSYFSSKRYRQDRQTESFDPAIHTSMSAPDKSHDELMRAFRQALSALSPKLRDVISLCALEGMSYEDAAKTLALPVGTIRSRLNAARLKLKSMMPTDLLREFGHES
ncbi:MAG: RNA polymerase sigma factor [Oligoflexia bacterium]|nr:RNA polymerase sigma factor [Oligoflexia bacterium]